jgi:hypothetical protein
MCFPDGREEWVFLDGLVVKTDPNLDERILLLPNGQREVHHKGEMVRYSVLLYVMFALSNGIFNETSHEAAGKQDSVRKALVTFSTLAYLSGIYQYSFGCHYYSYSLEKSQKSKRLSFG